MNIENENFEPNYIKMNYKNEIRFINELDIQEDNLDLETVIESFGQEIKLDELNPLFYKLIPKNNSDLLKLNIEQSKLYKKHFPFTMKNLIDSVNRILASDYKSNFVFNKQNLEDVSRVLTHIFESIKKYNIKNEKKLMEKIKNIYLNEKDIFNMFIDKDMMDEKKIERAKRIKRKLKYKFYNSKNPSYFNSTGNLPMVHELSHEENIDNKDDSTTITKKKKDSLYKIYSSDSENDFNSADNESEEKNKNIKKLFKRIKRRSKKIVDNIFHKNSENKDDNNIKNDNNINKFTKDNKIVVTKEYFLYPDNNYFMEDSKSELPIELIILIKKFENIKTLTLQIRDMNLKLVKENIFVLFNIKLLFPNYTEIKIDLNDEILYKNIINIYEIRGQDLFRRFKKNLRIYQYNLDYQVRTVNCWEPEGDIKFITENDENDIKYKFTSFGNNYILGENAFQNSNYFGNNLINIINNDDNNYNIIPGVTSTIKYIMPKKGTNNNNYNNDSIDEFEEEGSDDNTNQINDVRTFSEYPKFEKTKIFTTDIANRSITHSEIDSFSTRNKIIETNTGIKHLKRNTPELLALFLRDNKTPFQMIFYYCWFLEKIDKIKTLSLYFNDSFSIETEFFFLNEEIKFNGFHFLFFINKVKELNEVNFSFNSLDTRSFENILGIIGQNKNISILRINFFTSDINFNVFGLLKLCSIMKLSLQNLFKEQIITYINGKEQKDLEIEYFILNHKLDYYFEKNICCLFNIIKKNININSYEEIVFRFDLPLLILSCDKYILIIIKFIINILILITFTKNRIHTLKLISPELILNGRITPFLRYLFEENDINKSIDTTNNINNNEDKNKVNIYNKSLKNLIIQCKIFGMPNIFNICLYNNINGLTNITIGDLDLESFIGFLNGYEKYLDKMNSLISLKVGLNNTIISYNKVEKEVKKFINLNSKNLKEKVLFSFLELDNIDEINNLRIYVQKANIDKLVIQIGQSNRQLLNDAEFNDDEKNKNELESLFYIMSLQPFKVLIKDKIIKHLRKFFKKNRERIVVCKKSLSNYDF